eukprot:66250_1
MTYNISIGDVEIRVAYIAILGYIVFCLATLSIVWLCCKERTGMNDILHAPRFDENYDGSAFNYDVNIQMKQEIDLADKFRLKREKTEIEMMEMKMKPHKENNNNKINDFNDENIWDNINLANNPLSNNKHYRMIMESNTNDYIENENGYMHVKDISKYNNNNDNKIRVIVEEDEENENWLTHLKNQNITKLFNKLSFFTPIFFHFWDTATDLAVVCDWIPDASWNGRNENGNTFYFIIGSIISQIMYRLISGYGYAKKFNIYNGFLQFLDIQLFFEIYYSVNSKMYNNKSTIQLRWIRKMESVLESAPQAWIQLVYVFSLNNSKDISIIVQISLLFSILSITSSVVRSDEWIIREETNANKMCPPNWRFIIRSIFRLCEITTRICIMSLLSQIRVSNKYYGIYIIILIISLQIIFYLIMYKDGFLGNDLSNIIEILIVHPNLSLRISDEELNQKKK